WRWLGSLLDLLFWLLVTLGLFLHALDTGGGVLRFYMVAAVLGGAIGYFLLLSPLFLFLGYRMADFAGILFRLAVSPLTLLRRIGKKVVQNTKKNFHYRRKWYRIKLLIGEMDDAVPRGAAQRKGGGAHEDKTGGISDQTGRVCSVGGHRKRTAQSAHPDSQRPGGAGRTAGGAGCSASDQRRSAGRRRQQRRSRPSG
ncbi:MAG: hypothetical protein KH438_13650, partial [Oscillibacter sp.]|nr:hypothetical protein [Oscillibacter sp.]